MAVRPIGRTKAYGHKPIINNSSYKHLPVWVTATCDFTRFDDVKTSAGESVFLNPTSGGIALFTTTRVVFSGNNANLNKALIDNLFQEGANSVIRLERR